MDDWVFKVLPQGLQTLAGLKAESPRYFTEDVSISHGQTEPQHPQSNAFSGHTKIFANGPKKLMQQIGSSDPQEGFLIVMTESIAFRFCFPLSKNSHHH